MSRRKVSLTSICILGAWLCTVMPTTSNAIPFPDFTGHSENLNSVVNFAVLPPGDLFINVLTPFFQGGNGPTPNLNPQQFTYLYQITNHGGSSPFSEITEFALRPGARATTIGTFNPAGFRVDFLDQGRVVDASGIRGIDSLGLSGCQFPRCVGDGSGGDLDGAKGFGLGVRQDSSPRVNVSTSGSSLNPGIPLRWQFSGFSGGLTSPVFGYQSLDGPGFSFADERVGGGVGETLIVAAAVAPEPASLLVLASGLVGLLWWRKEQTGKGHKLTYYGFRLRKGSHQNS